MSQQVAVIRALQDQVRVAVQKKIPEDFQEDARSIFPDLGKVIHSAVAHYQPQTPEALLGHLKDNQTPAVKLLVELLTENHPHYFMAEVERKLVLRRKAMATRRQERRNEIERGFERAIKRIAEELKDVKPSLGTVPILDYLVQSVEVVDIDNLTPLIETPFWENPDHRESLKNEIDHHIYYFVVRLLDTLRSYDLPEKFKVRNQDLNLIRMALLFALREVFSHTVSRVRAGSFIVRKTHYGNRGDRMMDREMFLTRKRPKGLGRLIGGIREIYQS